jgi:S-adenosylmethionine:tRNA ribosyltransferase-isomerase
MTVLAKQSARRDPEQHAEQSAPPILDLDDYDFALPPERIAQHPSRQRDAARLLILNRHATAGEVEHARFADLADRLDPGDLLILNATRVEPARLLGRRESGGAAEALLLEALPASPAPRYRAMLKLSGRLRPGIRISFGPQESALAAQIASLGEHGEVVLEFEPGADPYAVGVAPLPPYIRRPDAAARASEDHERYQTIYARVPGAVAAPTAGLHFSDAVFRRLEERGIERAELVLHVGPGTFRPLDATTLGRGTLHSERYELPEATAEAIARTRKRGGRVIAVGTTSARVLESRAAPDRRVQPGAGETDIFLRPGSAFRVVDGLVTNFHLPRSSLLLLVAAFAGREPILAAYREAIAAEYRFYSYGDAMLIL